MTDPTPACGNPDHTRRTAAVARLSWPDSRYNPAAVCVGDLARKVRESLADGHPVLVELADGPAAPVVAAIKEVVAAHRRASSSPVRAILLRAPDAPRYDELPETIEERRKLPPRFHVPVWTDTGKPPRWFCAVCRGDGVVYGWPCEVAAEHGGEVFA